MICSGLRKTGEKKTRQALEEPPESFAERRREEEGDDFAGISEPRVNFRYKLLTLFVVLLLPLELPNLFPGMLGAFTVREASGKGAGRVETSMAVSTDEQMQRELRC